MDPVGDAKVHKCKHPNKDVCVKACIREHNRLVKMNDRYSQIRTLLGLNKNTSKVKTLVGAIQHIKMLKQILDASDEANAPDPPPDGNVQLADENDEPGTVDTAEELEQKYTLKEELRPRGPESAQIMSTSAQTKEMPYEMKLPAFKAETSTANDTDGHCNVLENGSNSPRKPLPIDNDDFVEHIDQPATGEEIIVQPRKDLVDMNMENLVDMEVIFTNNEESEYLHIPKHDMDVDMPLPSFASSIGNIWPSAIEDPSSGVVQKSEPMEEDCSLTAELERNLGEVSDDWLSYNLLEDDNFYDHQDRLAYMDTNSMAENDMEDLFTSLTSDT